MRKICWFLVIVVMSIIVHACADDSSRESEVAGIARLQVSFLLNLSQPVEGEEQQGLSRGNTAMSAYGSAFENRVRKETVRMLIYEATDQKLDYVGEVEQLSWSAVDVPSAAYLFKGVSNVPLQVGTTYRFMVMANGAPIVEIPQGEGPIYSRTDLDEAQGSIPLWGVTSHVVNYQPVQQLSTLGLTRAVAKVSVKLSDALRQKGIRLHRVWMDKAAPLGYAFPKQWRQAAFTADVANESSAFHPYLENNAEERELDFHIRGKDSASAVIYLPEYENRTEESAARISLIAGKGELLQRYDGAIEFKKYAEGKPLPGTLHALVRNRSYLYQIRHMQMGHPLTIESDILPWTVHEESWDYTDHVSVRSEGKMRWVEGTYLRIDGQTGAVVMAAGTPMVCSFLIDTPLEARWHASFIPVSGVANPFRFETHAINGGLNATGKVGEPARLHIRSVQPAVGENNAALLRIVVITKGGRTILVKNLLPESFGEVSEYTLVQPR